MVFFGQQDGSIQALNAKTGAPVWTNQVSDVNEFAGHTGQTGPPTDCDPTAGPNGDGLIFGGPERQQLAASWAPRRDRREDRGTRLALVHHAGSDAAAVHPDVGEPRRGGARRRRHVGLERNRPGPAHGLLGDRQRVCPARPAARQGPVDGEHVRARREHGPAQVVLAGGTPRQLGPRPRRHADDRERHHQRQGLPGPDDLQQGSELRGPRPPERAARSRTSR